MDHQLHDANEYHIMFSTVNITEDNSDHVLDVKNITCLEHFPSVEDIGLKGLAMVSTWIRVKDY